MSWRYSLDLGGVIAQNAFDVALLSISLCVFAARTTVIVRCMESPGSRLNILYAVRLHNGTLSGEALGRKNEVNSLNSLHVKS